MSDRTWNERSTTMSISIAPTHLILIPLPIASFLAVLATDAIYWATRDSHWAQVSIWLILAGLVTGPTAGTVGLIDFLSVDRMRPSIAGWVHIIGMGSVLLLTLLNFWLRTADPAGAILPWGLFLSFVTAVLLAVGAWYGRALAHRRLLATGDGNGGWGAARAWHG